MTKTLTEQWRKGTLQEGFYYILFASRFGKDYIAIDMFIPDEKDFMYSSCEDVKEVIAPVPSYDEYKRLQEQLKEANEMLKGAKHLTVKDSNGAIMFELVSPEINDYLKKWGVK